MDRKRTPVWHILSREETIFLYTDEKEFSKILDQQKAFWQIQPRADDAEETSSLVHVGCLVEPSECPPINLTQLPSSTKERTFDELAIGAKFAKWGGNINRKVGVGANVNVEVNPGAVAPILQGSKAALSLGTKTSGTSPDIELQRRTLDKQRRTCSRTAHFCIRSGFRTDKRAESLVLPANGSYDHNIRIDKNDKSYGVRVHGNTEIRPTCALGSRTAKDGQSQFFEGYGRIRVVDKHSKVDRGMPRHFTPRERFVDISFRLEAR